MQRIRGRLFEPRAYPSVESGRLRRFRVNQEGADSDALGHCRRLEQSVVNEAPSESLAMLRPIYSKTGEDDHPDRVPAQAMCDATWGTIVGYRPRR